MSALKEEIIRPLRIVPSNGGCPVCGMHAHYPESDCPRVKDVYRPEYFENWGLTSGMDPEQRKRFWRIWDSKAEVRKKNLEAQLKDKRTNQEKVRDAIQSLLKGKK